MAAKSEFRDRPAVEVELLDALVDRGEEGMTVFELRAAVDADIDRVEEALASLKEDGLITVEQTDTRFRVFPHDRVVPEPDEGNDAEPGFLESLRRKLGL